MAQTNLTSTTIRETELFQLLQKAHELANEIVTAQDCHMAQLKEDAGMAIEEGNRNMWKQLNRQIRDLEAHYSYMKNNVKFHLDSIENF